MGQVLFDVTKLQNFVEEFTTEEGTIMSDESMIIDWTDWETVRSFVERLLIDGGVLKLPAGARAQVFVDDADTPAFAFGLIPNDPPRDFPWVSVVGRYVPSHDIEPRDANDVLPVDGGDFSTPLAQAEAVLQFTEAIAHEVAIITPAFEKLWGKA